MYILTEVKRLLNLSIDELRAENNALLEQYTKYGSLSTPIGADNSIKEPTIYELLGRIHEHCSPLRFTQLLHNLEVGYSKENPNVVIEHTCGGYSYDLYNVTDVSYRKYLVNTLERLDSGGMLLP